MAKFKILLLGPDGGIASRIDLACEDEAVAREQAQQLAHDCETHFGMA
jgi:hypothetical protein